MNRLWGGQRSGHKASTNEHKRHFNSNVSINNELVEWYIVQSHCFTLGGFE